MKKYCFFCAVLTLATFPTTGSATRVYVDGENGQLYDIQHIQYSVTLTTTPSNPTEPTYLLATFSPCQNNESFFEHTVEIDTQAPLFISFTRSIAALDEQGLLTEQKWTSTASVPTNGSPLQWHHVDVFPSSRGDVKITEDFQSVFTFNDSVLNVNHEIIMHVEPNRSVPHSPIALSPFLHPSHINYLFPHLFKE